MSDHRRVSLSKSALQLSPCIAWAHPEAQWYNEDRVDGSDTEKRDNGISFHRSMDELVKTGSAKVSDSVLTLYNRAAEWYTEHLVPRCESIRSEVAYGIDWSGLSAYEFTLVTDRKYPDMPDIQFGTADIVARLSDGSMYVGDWKTGGSDGATEQLLSLACAVSYLHPGRRMFTSCLSVNENGVWPHEREVSKAELDAHWDAMAFRWESRNTRTEPVPGIHCTTLYCPHLAYCKAITRNTEKLADMDERLRPANAPSGHGVTLTDKPASDTHAGELMACVSASKRQAKYIEKGLQEYVTKRGGRVLAGNYEWGPGNNGWRWRRNGGGS